VQQDEVGARACRDDIHVDPIGDHDGHGFVRARWRQ